MNAMTHTSPFLLSLIGSTLTEGKDLKQNYKNMKMEKYVSKLCNLIVCPISSFTCMQIVYDTSIVITGISQGIEYSVSVSAMNQYTTGSSNDLLKGPQLILQERGTMENLIY